MSTAPVLVPDKEWAIWEGPNYRTALPRILVLGESRHDRDFSDREIIEHRIARSFVGGKQRTFTKFERAVLGPDCAEEEILDFWRRTAFYNYNRTFFPGQARAKLDYRIRMSPENIVFSQKVLAELKPTHVIVWGKWNWDSLDVGPPWIPDERIPGTNQVFCSTVVDGHTILFAYVRHPSSAFSPSKWNHVLSQFLKIPPR